MVAFTVSDPSIRLSTLDVTVKVAFVDSLLIFKKYFPELASRVRPETEKSSFSVAVPDKSINTFVAEEDA